MQIKTTKQNNLYHTLVTHHTVLFMKVKLQFFVDIASEAIPDG